MPWRLLEGHADHRAVIAQLRDRIADEKVGEVLDRHLALEGHAATTRGVRAHAGDRGCTPFASRFLQPGSDYRVVSIEVPPVGSAFSAGPGKPGLAEPAECCSRGGRGHTDCGRHLSARQGLLARRQGFQGVVGRIPKG